jgi:putative oxidoreductase
MPRLVYPVSRVLLSLVFLVSGLEKIYSWDITAGYLRDQGFPIPGLLLVLAATIEMFGGALIALGHLTRPAALVLAAYLVPVTLLVHPVGLMQGANPNPSDLLKNLAIIGGLMLLAAASPTPVSVDAPMEARARPLREREG